MADPSGDNRLEFGSNLSGNSLAIASRSVELQNLEQRPNLEVIERHNDNDLSSTNSDIENEGKQKRFEAKKESAMRALKTNLIFNLLVSLCVLILLIPSNSWRSYFVFWSSTIQKGVLPIATTMANFGTIRSVSKKFIDVIFKS